MGTSHQKVGDLLGLNMVFFYQRYGDVVDHDGIYGIIMIIMIITMIITIMIWLLNYHCLFDDYCKKGIIMIILRFKKIGDYHNELGNPCLSNRGPTS